MYSMHICSLCVALRCFFLHELAMHDDSNHEPSVATPHACAGVQSNARAGALVYTCTSSQSGTLRRVWETADLPTLS